MNSRDNFKASNWLIHSMSNNAQANHMAENSDIRFSHSTFKPADFFIPGWRGEGLISNKAIQIKNTVHNLTIDALSQYRMFHQSNRSLKLAIYNEFLTFAEYRKVELKNIKNFNDFWYHFQDVTSPYKSLLDDFSKIYCFRAVTIYLFRIKFLLDLARELSVTTSDDNLLNPLSFLGKIFKKDSSTELNCESLNANQYSWYRPTFEFKTEVVKLKDAFKGISLTELIKIFSTNDSERVYSITNYSHSLSHISVGQLINELLIKAPNWFLTEKTKEVFSSPFSAASKKIKVLNTLFVGNGLSSLSLSHWLAQDKNKTEQWDNLICPDFKGIDFVEGQYFKMCQELQLLSFLSQVASEQGHETIPFICKVMKDKYQPNEENHQTSLFGNIQQSSEELLFDRIVCNLTDLPKTNPHFYVLSQLNNFKNQIKKNGWIVLLSNQKLFVPSQSEKIEQFLKDYKINAQFTLEDLIGKGEIAQFIYVLSVRKKTEESKELVFKMKRELKEACHSFHFAGELSRFNKFQLLTNELVNFFKEKSSQTATFYQKNLDEKLNFDYHIDAIVEGKLLSSSTRDTGTRIHSNFFKNLYHSCIGLENFFNIEQIDANEGKKVYSNEILGIKTNSINFPLILIVNASENTNIKLELIPGEHYQAKLQQYGTAYYSYFGLNQKISDINLNAFREFFNSPIGHQVIQLQLSEVQTKLKAKVKALLIPKFFLNTQFIKNEQIQYLDNFLITKEDLLALSSLEIEERFNSAFEEANNALPAFSWHILGLMSYFNVNLNNIINDGFHKQSNKNNFSNPRIVNELVKLPSINIYPKNNDVYVEFKTSEVATIHSALTNLTFKNDLDNQSASLILISGNKEVAALHSHPTMISFVKYVLENAYGHKISDVITQLKVPSILDLETLFSNHDNLENSLNSLKEKTEQFIAHIFNSSLFKN